MRLSPLFDRAPKVKGESLAESINGLSVGFTDSGDFAIAVAVDEGTPLEAISSLYEISCKYYLGKRIIKRNWQALLGREKLLRKLGYAPTISFTEPEEGPETAQELLWFYMALVL